MKHSNFNIIHQRQSKKIHDLFSQNIRDPPTPKQPSRIENQSQLTNRSKKFSSNNSICFISPKKIAYFQKIDQTCLNETERTMLRNTSQRQQKVASKKLQLNNLQIDYKSIKKCLSPRSGVENPPKINLLQKLQTEKAEIENRLLKERQFYENMIYDLKLEVLQMQKIIIEKQASLEEKQNIIAQLEKEIYGKKSEIHAESLKSISTSSTQKNIELEPLQCNYSINYWEKIVKLESQVQSYQSTFQKHRIEIDILKKQKFDRTKLEGEIEKLSKINVKSSKKIANLHNKIARLQSQIAIYKDKFVDQSFQFQFSPDKNA